MEHLQVLPLQVRIILGVMATNCFFKFYRVLTSQMDVFLVSDTRCGIDLKEIKLIFHEVDSKDLLPNKLTLYSECRMLVLSEAWKNICS